jgi:hypothetical protein
LSEIHESAASVLILLGDKPIRWFLSYYDPRWRRLSDFGRDSEAYGRLHSTMLGGRAIEVLPLAHPRQSARLGTSSVRWYELHRRWMEGRAKTVLTL